MSAREVSVLPHGGASEIQVATQVPKRHVNQQVATTGEFALHVVPANGLQDSALESDAQRHDTPRILIVDDDVSSIYILQHTLVGMGDLHFAKSGEEALRLAQHLVPDLVLLDAHMPGLDGFEVCKLLKSNTSFKHVPIAFITRFSDPESEMRALDLGAADFIAKPYTPAVLQARVRNLLDLKRRTDTELRAVRDHWRRVGDARVADIVSAASDAIVTYDTDNKVVLINASACLMFGVEFEQVMGSDAQVLLGEDVLATGRTSEPIRATITRADSTPISVEVSVSGIGGGAERLTTVMLRDIGDRDRLEAESRSRLDAEAASRTKTLMMSYIAHEIGNPLNGLLGFAELMADDGSEPLAPHQAKRLGHIVECGRHLQTLMQDVTDIGRFETGNLTVDICSLDATHCVADASAAVSALAAKAGVKLSTLAAARRLHLSADVNRLHQCLVNLLTNAIKYNKRGGWIEIAIQGSAKEVSIAVRDGGLGMDPMQRKHLFEPFNRLGRQRATTPGAGLGLVITRQLIEAMDGQLKVESEPGTGSCFTIVLPSARIAAPSSAPITQPG